MILRVARHTDKLKELTSFYVEVIGLKVMGHFEDHDGYDGVFLGKENLNWHLEFTTSKDPVISQFQEDDLLVFYPQSQDEYKTIVRNVSVHSVKIYESKNPYWRKNGIMVKDPDGYGVIISNQKQGSE